MSSVRLRVVVAPVNRKSSANRNRRADLGTRTASLLKKEERRRKSFGYVGHRQCGRHLPPELSDHLYNLKTKSAQCALASPAITAGSRGTISAEVSFTGTGGPPSTPGGSRRIREMDTT